MERVRPLLFLALVVTSVLANNIVVNPKTLDFVDSYGRTVLFHGVNVVYKVPPYYPNLEKFSPQLSLTSTDMDNLRDWGFNVVRLGVMWPGVAPSAQGFNTTYLRTMGEIVDNLGSRGIYTIIDMHQDLFSRFFCGEGVPDWAVPQNSAKPFPEPIFGPIPKDPQGYPNITDCLDNKFSRYYFTDAVSSAFQSLYDNENGLQDHMINFWKEVASFFAGNSNVLGYELINEPWAGDIYTHPAYILDPGLSDRENLQPMYQKIATAIRTVDQGHIIFFEPAVSDYFHSGFTQGPQGPSYNYLQAFSYHVYCGPSTSTGDPTSILLCNATDGYFFDTRKKDIQRLGTGHFLTEFGAMEGTTIGVESIDFVTNQADRLIESWAYWQFKNYNDITTVSGTTGGESFYLGNGQLDTAKVKALARTYAQFTAGVPLVHSFNPLTAVFTLSFNATGYTTQAPYSQTVIAYSQQFYYPAGVQVVIEPASAATYQITPRNIVVTMSPPLTPNIIVNVTVSPKTSTQAQINP
eukprot:TRINITY_DN634_c0_g1_i4.p1 TRINITY_DN634_c0_g1~~TRINITY_DN634_c0_g1_i4.p1  ORF type:complete len:536 (-),score=168.48 TRINITY_DN634_c0_g1_i4:53-1615(-)